MKDLWISQGGVISVILFLVAINGIMGELGNGVDESLFANDLALYMRRNQGVTAIALQGVNNKLDTWAAERRLTFYTS